ncbi:hypothetical protein HYW42_05260 [Candidatus Daviesbacteria bacterium]|nr:hypothetical protein [Candidatus Daviesbacteria bacterium]
MQLFLPNGFHNHLKEGFFSRLNSRQRQYFLAAVADLVLIALVLISGVQPAKRFISPLVASLNSISNVTSVKTTPENFSFIPGQAPNRFKYIDLENLSAIAYFDFPVLEDGSINTGSWGYQTIREDEAQSLITHAHYFNTKVLITLSQFNKDYIESILDNPQSQEQLISQSVDEIKGLGIDGVVVDFEPRDGFDSGYQQKFNLFVDTFTQRIHQEVADSIVAVAIRSSDSEGFDLFALSTVSDKIFMVADSFAAPEFKDGNPTRPVYGSEEGSYWKKVSSYINNFSQKVPSEKLVMERAWYGNGDRYPLYVPGTQITEDSRSEPAHVFLDSEAVERLAAYVPEKGREAARRNIPIIGKALEQEGILDSNVLAYTLATVEHETDETFEPIDEIQGKLHARRLGYEGGSFYFGRGFIQLTHLRNYRLVGERIGMGDKLAENPELASTPEVAAKILAAFFKDNNIANLASQGNFVSARVPVNPDRNGWKVASLAFKYSN